MTDSVLMELMEKDSVDIKLGLEIGNDLRSRSVDRGKIHNFSLCFAFEKSSAVHAGG